MVFDFSIPAVYYGRLYILVLSVFTLIIAFKYSFSGTNQNIATENKISQIWAVFLTILIILFIGLRPKHAAFVDMNYYAYVYNNIYDGIADNYAKDSRGEWLFYEFGMLCKRLGFSDVGYFLSIATIYFGFMFTACWRLMRSNLFVAFLFCVVSFSCFTYAVNGMRNGMACSFALVAIALIGGNRWEKIISLFLMFCAINIHRSTALPCFCAISALLFVKDTKWAIYFWIASIFISLIAGNIVTEFFVNLGFDDRMENYANLDESGELMVSENEKSGFRVDFILYSIMPIIMAWYVTMKRNFKDKMYHIIATSYLLANAFWIMVIRSEQSNRFAYLSWFLYPIVIAYPLLRMNIWKNQDRKAALILLAYAGFTFFMNFIYYG